MPPSQNLSDIVLRDYQVECINAVEKAGAGSHLCQMATGLGKTVVFTNLVRPSGTRTLILSHRQELVHQPAKYYSCPVGFEEGTEHSSGEEVVSASVQLITPCILAGCPEGGMVCDPFMGSGTTLVTANQLNRNCIGFDVNPLYCRLVNQRQEDAMAQLSLFRCI